MTLRDKLLTDAKASADPFATFGLAMGQTALDEAHTPANASFNTGAMYLDTAPFGSKADEPAPFERDQT